MPSNDDFDIVVVGSGIAGLTTALFSSLAGLRAVVLEKADKVGGSSCWSHGAVWVGNNDLAAAANIADSRAQVADYLDFLGGGDHQPARTAALIDHGPLVLRMLREAGIPMRLIDVSDILVGKAPGALPGGRTLESLPIPGRALEDWRDRLSVPPEDAWRLSISEFVQLRKERKSQTEAIAAAVAADQLAQGPALVARLMIALRQRDVPIRTSSAVERLSIENGRVKGARLADGTSLRARQAVMLATGTYLADPDMAARFECLPEYRNWYAEGNDGDGIRLAGDLGGAIGITRNNRMIMLGYKAPHETSSYYAGEPSGIEIPRAHTIVVNSAGQRFGNEALFQEMAPAIRSLDAKTRKPKNLPCWLLFDSQYAETWGFSEAPPGQVPDWVPRSADLASLAVHLGIDPVGLEATVARFNGFVTTGIDEDFDRKPAWSATPGGGKGPNGSLGSIEVPPYYAVRLYPTGGASAGVRADTQARILNWRDEPIAGLYAAGDVTHHDEFGAGYQAGITFATAFTYAYLAVEDIRRSVER